MRAKYNDKVTYPLVINGQQLPYRYSLESCADLTVRATASKRGYSHGSTITGDGYIDGKKIKLSFLISGTNQADYDWRLNELLRLFYQQDYTLSVGNGYYNVSCMSASKAKWVKGYQGLRADVDITLLLADPFRYADDEKQASADVGGESTTINIVNAGSADVPLVVELIPVKTMADVTINHTDTGRVMRVADTLLTAPAVLTIDTKAGTVRRDANNAINAFSGQFLIAKPGPNTYEIKGSAGKVVIRWRDRWLA
ncbi:phage distal tail protein [Phascolarctobacterium succinatutens]|uniref:phage distal tail protein n=1 Tax=Phascolarctobacterium succinatutens TaxID=626940 RepID=UPI003F806AAA